MAEIAVLFLIKKLGYLLAERMTGELASMLVREAKLLKGIHQDIKSLKSEFESMQSFLKEADARAETEEISDVVKTWVKQVREEAYRAEDTIDQYIVYLVNRRDNVIHSNPVGRLLCVLTSELRSRIVISSEIQAVRTNIKEKNARANQYRFNSSRLVADNSRSSRWHDPRKASLYVEEDEVVGLESPKENLISKLVGGEPKRTVISIFGRPGVGKTTLAKKVYDSEELTGRFECRAWISVSKSYKRNKAEALLRKLIEEFCRERNEIVPKEIDRMEEASLIAKVKKYLQKRKYLVIFDDVWEIDFWMFMKNALPDYNNESRVIITTRSDKVAASCRDYLYDHVQEICPLLPDKAWELFCKKAFQCDYSGHCPPELNKISEDIVNKCDGLPLAIVAIGNLLSMKRKDVSEWKKFYDSLGPELESHPYLTSVKRIVFLSYHDLPYNLKSCFLYFSIMPEGYSISCARLIRLWIAEGFVEGQRGKTLEEVAEDHLAELISRSLVHVSWVGFNGKARTCTVHGLVLEMIRSKSRELEFCHVFGENDSPNTRRLSIHDKAYNIVDNICSSRIRSVFLFERKQTPKPLVGNLAANFKLLTVLDLQDSPVEYFPSELGNLFHLTYLSARRTKVKKIPTSIGKLFNLIVLDLKDSLVHELPDEISKLRKLQYLIVRHYDFQTKKLKVPKIPEGIGRLEELQKLYYVAANFKQTNLLEDLKNLKNLRKLGVMASSRQNWKALCVSIEAMKDLKALELWSLGGGWSMDDLQRIRSPPQNLQRLTLSGYFNGFPEWILKLENLVRLNLSSPCLIDDDQLKGLHALPNLLWLGLFRYDVQHLKFQAEGFQKLKVLRLGSLKLLKSVLIDEGALPNLARLIIARCPQLQEFPSSICHLNELKSFEFYDMPMEFRNAMQLAANRRYGIVELTGQQSFTP